MKNSNRHGISENANAYANADADTNVNALNLVCAAVVILCVCEMGIMPLQSVVSRVVALAVIRTVQSLFLLVLLVLTPGGPAFAGLSRTMMVTGLKTGLIWSFVFGVAALIAGGVLYLAGINAMSLIHITVPNGVQDNIMLFFLTAGVIGPIAEEIFFRGILYSALNRGRHGVVIALFSTTLIFALFHFIYNGHGGLPLFQIIGGLVFALSFESSKSLVTPVTIHILGNLAIFIIGGLTPISYCF